MDKGEKIVVKKFLTIPSHIKGMKGVVIGESEGEIIVEIGQGQMAKTYILPPNHIELDTSSRRYIL